MFQHSIAMASPNEEFDATLSYLGAIAARLPRSEQLDVRVMIRSLIVRRRRAVLAH